MQEEQSRYPNYVVIITFIMLTCILLYYSGQLCLVTLSLSLVNYSWNAQFFKK